MKDAAFRQFSRDLSAIQDKDPVQQADRWTVRPTHVRKFRSGFPYIGIERPFVQKKGTPEVRIGYFYTTKI